MENATRALTMAGGILIALSFAFGITAFEKEGSLPWALFQMGGGSAFALMFPVLAAFILIEGGDVLRGRVTGRGSDIGQHRALLAVGAVEVVNRRLRQLEAGVLGLLH